MRYVTREHLHVDRIASAWAIRRYVDPEASFIFVGRSDEIGSLNAVPFDMRGARLGHRGGGCTFETVLTLYELADPALWRMAAIIHAADVVDDGAAPPETAGVRAIFDGLRDSQLTDDERLRLGIAVCDALYRYCTNP